MMGATVILACRSGDRARNAMERMNKEFKEEKAKGTQGLAEYDTLAVEFLKVDLASFKSTVEFCEEFKKSGRPLHVLFCNAGLGFRPYARTEDGYEQCLQVNYLSHFIMIAKLLPIMKQSGDDCRLLMMSSFVHEWSDFDMKTINYEGDPQNYSTHVYYRRSKLYQIMQMFAMLRRQCTGTVTVNCINPGFVDTEIVRDAEGCSKCIICLKPFFAQSPYKGAKCSINCIVNPKLAGKSGLYYANFATPTTSSISRNEEKQEQLWATTMDIVRSHLTEEEIAGIKGNTGV